MQETVLPKPTDGVPRPVADRVQTRPRRRSTLHGVNRKSVACFARATAETPSINLQDRQYRRGDRRRRAGGG